MWIFTRDGFFIVVQHRSYPQKLLVRARTKVDLQRCRRRLPRNEGKVTHTLDEDYPWCVLVTKASWARYVSQQALEIDYPNFEAAMAASFDGMRLRQLHDVWGVMADDGRGYCLPKT